MLFILCFFVFFECHFLVQQKTHPHVFFRKRCLKSEVSSVLKHFLNMSLSHLVTLSYQTLPLLGKADETCWGFDKCFFVSKQDQTVTRRSKFMAQIPKGRLVKVLINQYVGTVPCTFQLL